MAFSIKEKILKNIHPSGEPEVAFGKPRRPSIYGVIKGLAYQI